MKILTILRDEVRELFQGRWPLAALIFAVPLGFALLFGFIYAEIRSSIFRWWSMTRTRAV